MMSDVQNEQRMQRMQRELELVPMVQQAMMQANEGLERLIAVGGLSPAEARWADQAMLAIWDRAMVLEGIARGREIGLAQSRPAPVPAEDVSEEDIGTLAAETAEAQDMEMNGDGIAEDGADLV